MMVGAPVAVIRYWKGIPWVAEAVNALVITGPLEAGLITSRRAWVAEVPQVEATMLAPKVPLVCGVPVISPSERIVKLTGNPIAE